MSKTCRPAPSNSDAGWIVRQVVQRSNWDTATETCPACGECIDLQDRHYQVELDRERTPEAPGAGSKLTRERRLLAFCDEACATSWLDETGNR